MDNDYYEFINDNVNINSMFDDNLSPFQEHDGQKFKANLKNTYIKKISSLLHNKTLSNQSGSPEEKYHQQKTSFTNDGQILQMGEQYRLVKNRESAKNSRKRKKMYVELLENKVQQLTEKHDYLKKICENNHNLTEQLRSKMSKVFAPYNRKKQIEGSQRILLFTDLQNAVLSYSPEFEIKQKLDQISMKYGPQSQERLMKIKHFFQEITENCLPDFVQYLMSISKYNKDIFDLKGIKEVDYMNLYNLKLNQKQKQIVEKQQQKLSASFDEFQSLLYERQDTQNMITQELNQMENTLSQLGSELLPSQMAKFVLNLEKQDLQNYFKDSFSEYFGIKMEDQNSETPLDVYEFIKEFQMNDSLDMEAYACFNLYYKSQEFIKSRKLNGLSQIQKIMDKQ